MDRITPSSFLLRSWSNCTISYTIIFWYTYTHIHTLVCKYKYARMHEYMPNSE